MDRNSKGYLEYLEQEFETLKLTNELAQESVTRLEKEVATLKSEVVAEAEMAPKTSRKSSKRFRLERIDMHCISVDSEDSPSMRSIIEGQGRTYDNEQWQDLVVYAEDVAGTKFEVLRETVRKDNMVGHATYEAELVCERSWGNAHDDDSVSCPLCFHRGHGAGACCKRGTRG